MCKNVRASAAQQLGHAIAPRDTERQVVGTGIGERSLELHDLAAPDDHVHTQGHARRDVRDRDDSRVTGARAEDRRR